MQMNIRPFTVDDYKPIAHLRNVNFPEFTKEPDEVRFRDDQYPANCRWARWVAESDDRVAGYAEYNQSSNVFHPRERATHGCAPRTNPTIAGCSE